MKIIKYVIVELDQDEIRQAIINYVENRTDHKVNSPANVTVLPASLQGGVIAKVEVV